MINIVIPYVNKNQKSLGEVYNYHMARLENDSDYCIFMDHDATPTTYSWFKQIEEILEQNPTVGAFTCLTNRVYCKWQLAQVDRSSNDIKYHREIGANIQAKNYHTVSDKTTAPPMSGVMIVLRKDTWKKIKGFDEGPKALGIDNDFHLRVKRFKEKLYLMHGVYLYHWYSNSNLKGNRDTTHLKW